MIMTYFFWEYDCDLLNLKAKSSFYKDFLYTKQKTCNSL